MQLARALLLSSKNQAQAYEYLPVPGLIPLYRFLITDKRETGEIGLRFHIFCMRRVEEQERVRYVLAELPHVDEVFEDLGRLQTFLHRFQIPLDTWQPLEEE